MTYLSDKCVVLVELDPGNQLIISWISGVVRLIFIGSPGLVKVVIIKITTGILTIFKYRKSSEQSDPRGLIKTHLFRRMSYW